MEASEFLGPGAPNPTLRFLEFLRSLEFQADNINVSCWQELLDRVEEPVDVWAPYDAN